MTLARTHIQITVGDWHADIGEVDDVLKVFIALGDASPQTSPTATSMSFPLSDMATLYDELTGGTSPTYLLELLSDPIVNPPGSPVIPDQPTNDRYSLRYVQADKTPLLTFPPSTLADLTTLISLVRDSAYTDMPNSWDSTLSPSTLSFGFYPGRWWPSHPRAIPGLR